MTGGDSNRERDFKEWLHTIVATGKSKICTVAGDPGKGCSLSPKVDCWQNPLFPFVLGRPSTDWTRPACIMEGNLLYAKSLV